MRKIVVNLYEDECDRKAVESARNRIFKTKAGFRILDLYVLNGKPNTLQLAAEYFAGTNFYMVKKNRVCYTMKIKL